MGIPKNDVTSQAHASFKTKQKCLQILITHEISMKQKENESVYVLPDPLLPVFQKQWNTLNDK